MLEAPSVRLAAVCFVCVLVGSAPVAGVPGAADGTTAQPAQSNVGGTVTVADGETVDEIAAVAGTIIVEEGGTVEGSVSGLAGNVYIDGTVEGDVSVAAGNVEISGTVSGDVSAAAGNLLVAEGATVSGDVEAGAGNVRLAGTVEGDVSVGAETIVLGDGASIAGDMRYDGDLEGNEAAVAGDLTRDSTVGVEVGPTIGPVASWLFDAYALLLHLLLGAALLALFPRFSTGVAERVADDPVRTGLAGIGVLVAVPVVLIAVAITVIGIPITLVGSLVFALSVWIGIVYGRFAVAAWLLSYAGIGNRWLALVVGLIAGAVLGLVPYLGGLINFLIFLLGFGALAVGLYVHARGSRREPSPGL
ncbi:polymer-forming cytoskeletal protein [Saliphagus infecundisoli]|uniref:Polymer-forming cytoskeletal protein n=1 Tax=Saliphagus infecundisoli TaxID=1849069 RepID=A0ABD5QIE4_9EURY|nr:polymer-forming cytoskeletal protein [Saliphagus infecundisoli]